MNRLSLICFLVVALVTGCSGGTPTRPNDFTPLTSIEIVAVTPAIETSRTIAVGTSTKLAVNGDRSGLFTSDVTDQAVWSSSAPAVAGFVTAAEPSRVTALAPGTAILTATVAGLTANFTLTVSSATITTLTITPAAPTISAGLSTQFSVSGLFSDSTTQDLTVDATWASSNSTVATVSDAATTKGFAQALSAGTSVISAAFGGISGTTLLTVTVPVLQSIAITPTNPSLLSLLGTNFKATGTFSDGTSSDITSQVSWSSSNTNVATIAASGGAATAIAQGSSSISASLNGISGTTNLKVTGGSLNTIALAPANPILVNGTAVRMTATGTFSNGSIRDITGLVRWSTATSSIATVTAPGGNLAFLNAIAATPIGTPTTVSATSGAQTGSTNLTVTTPTLTTLTLSSASGTLVNGGLSLITGTSGRFILTAGFSDGSTQDVTASTTWTSSSTTIAQVGNSDSDRANKGRVTGAATGTATITAAFGGLTVTAPAAVTTRTLQGLAITVAAVTVGNQVKFAVVADFGGGITRDVTEDAAWTIDNTSVAILADGLNQPGQVVGVDSGSATLTASFGGKSQSVTVTVP